jgi:transposase
LLETTSLIDELKKRLPGRALITGSPGQTAAHHTTEEFVAFLGQIVALEAKGREIHIIADNLSAHKTKRVAQFLAEHPKLHLQFTPTYSSWLNQVELWFARIERDVVARGVFTSVNDLTRRLLRYIRHHNRHAAPIKWAYRDFSHRIIATFDSAVSKSDCDLDQKLSSV